MKHQLFNTAIVQNEEAHNLLLTNTDGYELASRNITPFTALLEIFPDKSRNLNGHKLKLIQMHAPPYSVIIRGSDGKPSLDGTQGYLLDLILKRLNATYELIEVEETDDIQRHFREGNGDFCLNKVSPFWRRLIGKCDFRGTVETDSIRIMIRSLRQNNVTRTTFFTAEMWINIITIFIANFLYSLLFDQRPLNIVKNWFYFSQILLQMPSPIKCLKDSKRIFLAATLLFCLVQSVGVTTSITSRMVSYLPDSGINSIKDIVRANISIYGNSYSISIIKALRFDLDKEFVDRLEPEDTFPWNLNTTSEFAYIANTVIFRRYIESVTYNDPHDKQRFQLFPGYVALFPVFYVFPKHSPIAAEVQRIHFRTSEAGLMERWSLMKLNLLDDWSYFKPSRYSGLKAEEYLNLWFAFFYLIGGNLFATLVFAIEYILGHYWIRPTRRTALALSWQTEVIKPYCN